MRTEGQASLTAFTAAAARAAHLIVDDEPVIFADTLAEAMLGERAEEFIGYHRLHGTHPVLATARAQATCRSRYTEDRLARGIRRGIGQYVILGAGLDSFAQRWAAKGRAAQGGDAKGDAPLDRAAQGSSGEGSSGEGSSGEGSSGEGSSGEGSSGEGVGGEGSGGQGAGGEDTGGQGTRGQGTRGEGAGGEGAGGQGTRGRVRVFEVDHPATQEWKRGMLPGVDDVVFVAVDFSGDQLGEGLRRGGFDFGAPAFVSWLGVTMYLEAEAIERALSVVGGFAAGSEIVVDYMLPAGLRDAAGVSYAEQVGPVSAEQGEPWVSFFAPEGMAGLLRRHGFGALRDVGQREMAPAAVWRRSDSLRPAELSRLAHATIPVRG